MGGTKFFVLRMKDLIRIGAIALAALVLLILILVFLLPGRGGRGGTVDEPGAFHIFVPGTYTSTLVLNNKPVEVRVVVDETEILEIYMSDLAEVQRVFYPLFEPRLYDLADEILRYQSAVIYPATDYPVTTGILQQAVKAALDMAMVGE